MSTKKEESTPNYNKDFNLDVEKEFGNYIKDIWYFLIS